MTTALIITAILLALFLGFTIALIIVSTNKVDNLLRNNKTLHWRIKNYQAANADPKAIYTVKRVVTDDPEFVKYNGKWAVCRMTCKRGYTFKTTIKVFTDEDNEFNQREAEELCEKLNEK